MKNIDTNKAVHNLAGQNTALSKETTEKTAINKENIHPKVIKSKRYITASFQDKHGIVQIITVYDANAYSLIFLWENSEHGVTQKDIYQGVTLKDKVFHFGSCHKSKIYMMFRRELESHNGGSHKRYWLQTKLTFLDEQGFPEIRKYIRS
jgi:hypothetical protein